MTYLMLNVRQAISDELNSSVEFSSKLVVLGLRHVPSDKLKAMTEQLGSELARVGNTRHLRIGMTTDSTFSGVQTDLPAPDRVPQWFVRLVHPEPIMLVRVVQVGDGPERIVIRADAADEISESWREIRPLMLMLVVFGVVANALVYLVLGRSLKSLQSVSHAFQSIEEGDYDTTVAQVGVPDVDAIVKRFNHMREVLKRSKNETQSLAQRSLAIQEDERRPPGAGVTRRIRAVYKCNQGAGGCYSRSYASLRTWDCRQRKYNCRRFDGDLRSSSRNDGASTPGYSR